MSEFRLPGAFGGIGIGIACDGAGNVYYAYSESDLGPDNIDEFTPERAKSGLNYVATLAPPQGSISAIAFSTGTVLAVESGNVIAYMEHQRGGWKNLGQITVNGGSYLITIAFEKGGRILWATSLGPHVAYRIDGKTGTLLDTIRIPGFSIPRELRSLRAICISALP